MRVIQASQHFGQLRVTEDSHDLICFCCTLATLKSNRILEHSPWSNALCRSDACDAEHAQVLCHPLANSKRKHMLLEISK
jgi:hypothetical protein